MSRSLHNDLGNIFFQVIPQKLVCKVFFHDWCTARIVGILKDMTEDHSEGYEMMENATPKTNSYSYKYWEPGGVQRPLLTKQP
jgi:hypothetical protein